MAANYMDNATLQSMFDEMGDRISCIIFDNKVPIFIGYPSAHIKHVNELVLKTINDVDMVGVPMKPRDPKLAEDGAKFLVWHPTIFLQVIYVADEDHPKMLMDPFDLG